MHKQILFSLLLIANTFTYGMKRQNPNIFLNPENNTAMVLFNTDIIPQITTALCKLYNYKPQNIRKDISALSQTCTFFCNFYDNTLVKQNIIRLCSEHHNSNDKRVARALGCSAITKKIDYFTDIALNTRKEFTAEDLKEEWYLTMYTTFENEFLHQSLQRSLLHVALYHSQLKKVHTILDNTKELNFRYATKDNLLYNIVEDRANMNRIELLRPFSFRDDKKFDDLLFIARRLLTEKAILVDGRAEDTQMTALMQATNRADKPFVTLLLEFGADPDLTGYDTYRPKTVTAFNFEPEKGWLQAIINEVKANKNKAAAL